MEKKNENAKEKKRKVKGVNLYNLAKKMTLDECEELLRFMKMTPERLRLMKNHERIKRKIEEIDLAEERNAEVEIDEKSKPI